MVSPDGELYYLINFGMKRKRKHFDLFIYFDTKFFNMCHTFTLKILFLLFDSLGIRMRTKGGPP